MTSKDLETDWDKTLVKRLKNIYKRLERIKEKLEWIYELLWEASIYP